MFFYKIGVAFYFFAIRMAALFNAKARLFVSGRKSLFDRLKELLSDRGERKVLWVHCASVGEFEQGRPVIEEIRKKYPEYFILLTFFSPSGYELRKNYPNADAVSYLPTDVGRNPSRFLDIVCPDMAIFVKYEFWYGFLSGLKKRDVPVYLISAILRRKQFMTTPLLSASLRGFNTVFVQNEESRMLAAKAGAANVLIAGDTRFDRVMALRTGARKENPVIEAFSGKEMVWIAGSTHDDDESMIASALPALGKVKFILVPHEVDPAHISRIKRCFRKYRVALYSECASVERNSLSLGISGAQILLVDCVGILSAIYRYASFAYIGGGFTAKGIHNILEPATYGCPAIIGKNYRKFQEAVDLVGRGGAVAVKTPDELASILSEWSENISSVKAAASVCSGYVAENLGATDFIISEIFKNR